MTKTRKKTALKIISILLGLAFALSCLSLCYSPSAINHKPKKLYLAPNVVSASPMPEIEKEAQMPLWLGVCWAGGISAAGVGIYLKLQKAHRF